MFYFCYVEMAMLDMVALHLNTGFIHIKAKYRVLSLAGGGAAYLWLTYPPSQPLHMNLSPSLEKIRGFV